MDPYLGMMLGGVSSGRDRSSCALQPSSPPVQGKVIRETKHLEERLMPSSCQCFRWYRSISSPTRDFGNRAIQQEVGRADWFETEPGQYDISNRSQSQRKSSGLLTQSSKMFNLACEPWCKSPRCNSGANRSSVSALLPLHALLLQRPFLCDPVFAMEPGLRIN